MWRSRQPAFSFRARRRRARAKICSSYIQNTPPSNLSVGEDCRRNKKKGIRSLSTRLPMSRPLAEKF